jgi:hypothetical protein
MMTVKNVRDGAFPPLAIADSMPAIADSMKAVIVSSPGTALLSAALLGFLVGRVFSRN